MTLVQIDVSVRHNCNAESLNSPADMDDEDQEKQYDSASRFADALSRIGEICRGVPMTLSVEQYLKRDNGMNNCTPEEQINIYSFI